MDNGPIFSHDNKKNTFNNGGNNTHGLKTLRVNRPLEIGICNVISEA